MASLERRKRARGSERNASIAISDDQEDLSDVDIAVIDRIRPGLCNSQEPTRQLHTSLEAPSRNTKSEGLQIILINTPLQGQTDEQRREVRAHAMREYHKRKIKRPAPRLLPPLRQKTSKCESTDEGTLAIPNLRNPPALERSAAPRRNLRQPQHSISSSDPDFGPHTSSHSDYAAPTRHENITDEDDLLDNDLLDISSSRQTASGVLQRYRATRPNFAAFGKYSHPSGLPEFDRWQYDTRTPYALCMGSGAPTLYMQARRWPFVRHACGATPGISLWMPEITIPLPSAYAQRPCLLKSAKTVPWISTSLEYLEFKGETVKWINARLEDPRLGTDDVTIGVIMCLANWEIARGNVLELEHHMNGLQQIIQIRGGINSLATVQHFQIKIALVDLFVAALNISKPRFQSFFIPQPSPPPPHIQGLDRNPIPDNPLLGNISLGDVLKGSPFGGRGIELLQRMRRLTDAVLEPVAAFAGSYAGDRTFLERSDEMISSGSEVPYLDDEVAHPSLLLPHLLLTPLIHAANIYSSAIIPYLQSLANPLLPRRIAPFSSPQNHTALAGLVEALQFPTNDATFAQYPGVLVWILLVGATAAEGREERGFLVMFLARVGTGSGYGWWKEMREMTERFREVRKVIG